MARKSAGGHGRNYSRDGTAIKVKGIGPMPNYAEIRESALAIAKLLTAPGDNKDWREWLIPAEHALEAAEKYRNRLAMYLIWSNEHQAWWRPNSCGYTIYVDAAGRYGRDEALSIASGARDGWIEGEPPPEIAISEADILAHKMQMPRQRRANLKR